MIHDRSTTSISLASASGILGGSVIGAADIFSAAWVAGMVLALAGGTAALWFHPDPREIAISWNNQFGEPEESDPQ